MLLPGIAGQSTAPDPSPARGWERSTRGLSVHEYNTLGGMVQGDKFREFQQVIPESRFRPYLAGSGGDVLAAYDRYVWNIALSESLYPCLNVVEIALRSAIHRAAFEGSGDEYWFLNRLTGLEQSVVSGVQKNLAASGKPANADNFIPELLFGFWISLFTNRYEGILLPWLLRPVFPNAPRRQRTRRAIWERLNRIRRLRNRVFHHEPIWHWPDLPEHHRQILETIGWISPAMLELTRPLDRFHGVYTGGERQYAAAINSRSDRGDD